MGLSDEAKLNLYETIGFLVGMPNVPVPKQVQLLDGVLGPQIRRIAENLQRAAAAAAGAGGGAGLVVEGEKDGDDAIAAELAAGVGAMANVSKGFKPVVAAEVEARFFQVGLAGQMEGDRQMERYTNILYREMEVEDGE